MLRFVAALNEWFAEKNNMKSNRREFIKKTTLGSLAVGMPNVLSADPARRMPARPAIISTWGHGFEANKKAWELIEKQESSLDAVEAAVRLSEADPKVTSVGYGGLPDATGKVTLDASIMDSNGNCGAVSFLQHIKHPITVARQIMEKTDHVMLSGNGALQFALSQGHKMENLLTKDADLAWQKWKKESGTKPMIDKRNHDTIGMLAIDQRNRMAGACTTSGLSWKMNGRVGDSPIIGAGMYVDSDVGGAVATGFGEAVIKVVGSFLVVELMRQGYTPEDACKEAIARIEMKQKIKNIQVGFLAMSKSNEYGAYALHPGFEYALTIDGDTKMYVAESLLDK